MAYQKGIEQAWKDRYLDLTYWADHVVKRLKLNFHTQYIFPFGSPGPYPGSAYRHSGKNKGEQLSTGDAYRSIYAAVYRASGGDTEKISFFFNYYLYFVDMGVGGGQPIEKVDRDAKARYNRRYKNWDGEGDRQSRPAIAMEIRHQLFRLQAIVSAYYCRLVTNGIIFAITDEEPDTSGASQIIT